MRFEVEHTKALFFKGKPLLELVAPQFRFELCLIWHGGMKIIEKIERQDYDTLTRRPRLSAADKLSILIRAITL